MDWALRNPIKLILCTDVAEKQRNLNGFCLSAIQLQKSFIYIQESVFSLFRIVNSFLLFHLPFFSVWYFETILFAILTFTFYIQYISSLVRVRVFFLLFQCSFFFHASYLEFDRSMTSITFFYSIELTPRKKKWRKIRRQMSRILKKET